MSPTDTIAPAPDPAGLRGTVLIACVALIAAVIVLPRAATSPTTTL